MTLVDEYGFFPLDALYEVVIPTLQHQTVFVVISSQATGKDSINNELVKLKYEDGSPIFLEKRLILACPMCIAKGVGNKCEHNLSNYQPWLSKQNHRRILGLMQLNEQAVSDEIMNIERLDASMRVFPLQDVKRLYEDKEFEKGVYQFSSICVTIDPAGGGSRSEYVVMTIGYVVASYLDTKVRYGMVNITLIIQFVFLFITIEMA
jgi:hypothetical protein